jgi:teichoic acid transport system permease protein
LSPVFQLWSDVIVKGTVPGPVVWAMAIGWALIFFVAGTLYYVSRERDFAVRI